MNEDYLKHYRMWRHRNGLEPDLEQLTSIANMHRIACETATMIDFAEEEWDE